jgi:spore coat polysaccharide biosynthesis predicted glycosyltransferase SpsG
VVDTALALGCDVLPGAGAGVVARIEPDVLVVDDPVARKAAAWIAAGRRTGCLVVSIHDLGLGCRDADLVVDGSVARVARATRGTTLAGPRFAVLDPGLKRVAARPRNGTRVLISLGGGPRARRAGAIAEAIARVQPDALIRVVGGFLSDLERPAGDRITWIDPPRGLGEELSRTDIAVLGGGVSLYEACALGVPSVAVPVVRGQVPTVSAFERLGAALAVRRVDAPAAQVAVKAARLLRDDVLRRRVSMKARKVVDADGASRVAAAVGAAARARRDGMANENRSRKWAV